MTTDKIVEHETQVTEKTAKIARCEIIIADHHGPVAEIRLGGDRTLAAKLAVAERRKDWHHDGAVTTSTDTWFARKPPRAIAAETKAKILGLIAAGAYTAKTHIPGYDLGKLADAIRRAAVIDVHEGQVGAFLHPHIRVELHATYQTNAIEIDGQKADYDDELTIRAIIAPEDDAFFHDFD